MATEASKSKRRRPNILITGTPGVGKTTTASLLAVCTRLTLKNTRTFPLTLIFSPTSVLSNPQERLDHAQHLNIGDWISQYKCYEGRDEELDTNILDEDKLIDILEPVFEKDDGGLICDFHIPAVFPEDWFDLVLVLRTNTENLFDRLTKRNYSEQKRSQNMDSEIMQVVLDEARESYPTEIIHEVNSNTVGDMEQTVERVKQWRAQWYKDNGIPETE